MAVASATAAGAAAKAVVPPASAFSELLRRSRFASYDPAIAQTYTAPPAYARRGNYGLKRAIPMPYKDSYISLPSFEHHAHFTEWNNAESQVKFIKRVEEMGVCPRPMPGQAWDKGLGEARTQWLIDSEFAEYDYPQRGNATTEPAVEEEAPSPPKMDNLRDYGKQGPGGYGSRRPPPRSIPASSHEVTGSHSQLNIESLNPHQFQRYLDKLRKLGPEFRAYLVEQHRSRYTAQRKAAAQAEGLPEPTQEDINAELESDDLLLFVAARSPAQKLHRKFLSKHFAKDYLEDDPSGSQTKIEGQPHRVGGLSYTHPSPLDSLLNTSPQPGLVLQIAPKHNSTFAANYRQKYKQEDDYLALFGGIVAKVPPRTAGIKIPFYYPDTEAAVKVPASSSTIDGPTPTNNSLNLENSQSDFRMTRITLRTTPKVVSYSSHKLRPSKLLSSTSLDTEVVPELPWSKRNLTNPHRPGSYDYTSHSVINITRPKYSPGGYGSVTGMGENAIPYGSSFARFADKNRDNRARRALMGSIEGTSTGNGGKKVGSGNGNRNEFRDTVTDTLMGIVGRRTPSEGEGEGEGTL